MANVSIQVADKPTLDTVKDTCDDILEAVSGGGGDFSLSDVHVYVGDFANDELTVTHGGLVSAKGYITT